MNEIDTATKDNVINDESDKNQDNNGNRNIKICLSHNIPLVVHLQLKEITII